VKFRYHPQLVISFSHERENISINRQKNAKTTSLNAVSLLLSKVFVFILLLIALMAIGKLICNSYYPGFF